MSIKPKIIRHLKSAKVHFWSKFGNLIVDRWWMMACTSSKYGNFYFEVKFDLEVQGQLTPKTIGILTKVFCSSGPNLVILTWTGDKLLRGQASDYRTHRRTHRQMQATTIREGQKLASGKNCNPVIVIPGGHFKNTYELLNVRALKISLVNKSTSFNAWVWYFVWNFKGTFWNSTQNILPIHWKIWLLYKIEI